jgi:hypothetical protein
MSMPLDTRHTIISRFFDQALHPLAILADGLRMMFAEARARRAARQATDELAHLDPAILADIGIETAAQKPGWMSIETACPHCLAIRELGRNSSRR